MTDIRRLDANLSASGRRFALVAARFNDRVVGHLIDGAVDCLRRHGAGDDDLLLVRVPGAWELPQAVEPLAAGGSFDAVIALGVVIRGETPHFEYVSSGCTNGLSSISSRHGIPVALGVLTCDTTAQAEARAGGKAGNKGWDAALAAIEMANLRTQITDDQS